MTYSNDSHIETLDQAKAFLDYIINEREISILPEENENLTVKDLHLFDRLTEEAQSVCEREGVDLLEIVASLVKK